MSKTTIKFYVVPGIVAIVIIVVLLLIPINKKSIDESDQIKPTITISLPTKTIIPDNIITISPTIVPPQPFTGADINQEIPENLKVLGEQKTALRRLVPLTLSFGTVEFDYTNDLFIVRLDQFELFSDFEIWLQKNYPSIPIERFAIE